MRGTRRPPARTQRPLPGHRARTVTHIAFRELRGWWTGDGPLSDDAAPPLIITLTVPEAWREEEADTFIGLVRTAVKRMDDHHGRRLGFCARGCRDAYAREHPEAVIA